MSGPRIRLGEAATDFERELLGAWDGEHPSAGARTRALALMGAGAAVSATSAGAATGATGVAGGAGAVGGAIVQAAAPQATLGLLALGKWVVAGAILAAGVVSVAPYAGRTEDARVPPPALSAAGPPVSAPLHGAPARAPAEEPAPSMSAPAVVRRAPAALPRPSQPSPHSPIAEPSPLASAAASVPANDVHPARALGDQVASLDRARAALASGDAAQAIRAVDDYDARFPDGMLAQEAAVVRIDALVKLGRSAEAADLGQRFVAAHPASPYAAKVRQALGQPPGANTPP